MNPEKEKTMVACNTGKKTVHTKKTGSIFPDLILLIER
jgi:hypothetical protein